MDYSSYYSNPIKSSSKEKSILKDYCNNFRTTSSYLNKLEEPNKVYNCNNYLSSYNDPKSPRSKINTVNTHDLSSPIVYQPDVLACDINYPKREKIKKEAIINGRAKIIDECDSIPFSRTDPNSLLDLTKKIIDSNYNNISAHYSLGDVGSSRPSYYYRSYREYNSSYRDYRDHHSNRTKINSTDKLYNVSIEDETKFNSNNNLPSNSTTNLNNSQAQNKFQTTINSNNQENVKEIQNNQEKPINLNNKTCYNHNKSVSIENTNSAQKKHDYNNPYNSEYDFMNAKSPKDKSYYKGLKKSSPEIRLNTSKSPPNKKLINKTKSSREELRESNRSISPPNKKPNNKVVSPNIKTQTNQNKDLSIIKENQTNKNDNGKDVLSQPKINYRFNSNGESDKDQKLLRQKTPPKPEQLGHIVSNRTKNEDISFKSLNESHAFNKSINKSPNKSIEKGAQVVVPSARNDSVLNVSGLNNSKLLNNYYNNNNFDNSERKKEYSSNEIQEEFRRQQVEHQKYLMAREKLRKERELQLLESSRHNGNFNVSFDEQKKLENSNSDCRKKINQSFEDKGKINNSIISTPNPDLKGSKSNFDISKNQGNFNIFALI